MLRPELDSLPRTAAHRDRVLIDNAWHIPVRDIDTLEGLAYGTGLPITYPAAEGWATTHVGSVRVCAWYRSPR